ncbi:WD40 repeat domain-containing protein, partial [Actinokineospora sp.]|uniref:WD40 repeat domain-containing protein n=1 Tax=Actinokineospora sp. TaxID=1872133 RepID=UPI003D6B3409
AHSLREGQVALGPMSPTELRAAIVRPARAVGLSWEPGLVELLLRDLGVQPGHAGAYAPGALPLLAHALLTTWQNREGRRLTVAGYHRTGGLHAAVATTAERVYAQFDTAGRDTARRLLLRLVQVDRDTGQTRRRVSLDHLGRHLPGTDLGVVVSAFVRARLLTADTGGVEITHEAMLTAWPRLRDWIEADRAGLYAHQRLTEAAETWDEQGRDRGALYQGAALAVASAWATDHGEDVTSVERAFLEASTRERRRGVRRLRRLVAVLSTLVVLAVIATGAAFWQSGQATRHRDIAISQRVAEYAGELRESDPALAAQLAVAAYRRADTVEARGAVLSSAPPLVGRYRTGGGWVRAVATSPDSALAAVAADDGDVQLWDLTRPGRFEPLAQVPASGRVRCLLFRPGTSREVLVVDAAGARLWDVTAHPRAVAFVPGRDMRDASFTADGHLLATTTGASPSVRVWAVADPAEPVLTISVSDYREGMGTAVSISPDGRTLLTGGGDGRYLLWDTATSTRLAILDGFLDDIRAAVFSPDGRHVALSDTSNDTWSHELDHNRAPGPPLRLPKDDSTWDLAFAPDSAILATGGNDQLVRLWDPRTGTELTRFPHPHRVLSVAFTPDGSAIVAGGMNGVFYVWHDPRSTLTTMSDRVHGLVLSEDRRLAVTAGTESAQLWDISDPAHKRLLGETPPLPNPPDRLLSAPAISRDGRLLATIGLGYEVVLWDITEPRTPTLLSRSPLRNANTVTFAPDSRTMVTGDNGGRVIVWDIWQPRAPRTIATREDNFDDINAIDFTDDGKTMATADTNGGVRLWDMTDLSAPRQTAHHSDHSEAVTGVRFTRDGRALVSTSYDWTIRIWDLTDPDRQRAILTGHSAAVSSPDISPDGRTLLTTGRDRTARLWDITDPRAPHPIAGFSGRDTGEAAFTADGRSVVSVGAHTLRLWNTDPTRTIGRVCAETATPMTPAEWSRYFNDLPYSPPCG